jgi:hypothetical protein
MLRHEEEEEEEEGGRRRGRVGRGRERESDEERERRGGEAGFFFARCAGWGVERRQEGSREMTSG